GETEGFAVSTRQELGEAVRGYELNELFALDRRLKVVTYFSGGGHCQLGPALAKMAAGEGAPPVMWITTAPRRYWPFGELRSDNRLAVAKRLAPAARYGPSCASHRAR